jgi:two-component system nitrogen regulation response regulator NtrX
MKQGQQAVLVIDRDADVREALQLALQDEGYAVRTAHDTTAGLSMLRTSSYPTIVMFDVVPQQQLSREESGLALLEAIEQDAALERHAYIMLTTAPEQAYALTGPLSPRLSIPIVRKPFDLGELLGTVAQAALETERRRAYSRVG